MTAMMTGHVFFVNRMVHVYRPMYHSNIRTGSKGIGVSSNSYHMMQLLLIDK